MSNEFTERQQKAFGFVENTIKHMTGLSTVIFASSILLSKFYIPEKETVRHLIAGLLIPPWLCLMLSVSLGVVGMIRLTAVYSEKGGPSAPSINDQRIAKPVKWQLITFLLGLLGLMVVTAYANLFGNA